VSLGRTYRRHLRSAHGAKMLTATGVRYLVGFVLAIAPVAGTMAGLPPMYARRRLAAGLAD